MIKTTLSGYPKIGPNRELKKIVESFWKGNVNQESLLQETEKINLDRMNHLKSADLDFVPVNDFSLYDFILDLSTMFDVIPERFQPINNDLDQYFAMARGNDSAIACEMTKWFDTNYHIIVPEFTGSFKLSKNRPLKSYQWAKEELNIKSKPVLVGPLTYILSGKIVQGSQIVKTNESTQFKDLVLSISKLYNQILLELDREGVEVVQLDEPSLVLDLSDQEIDIAIQAYEKVTQGIKNINVFVHTYYESLSHYKKLTQNLPVSGIGLDFTVNEENLKQIQEHGFPKDKKLQAGILSGRDPWKIDYKKTMELVDQLKEQVDENRLVLSNSSPLFHLPVSLIPEQGHLDKNLYQLLSFADERLDEMKTIKKIIQKEIEIPENNLDQIRKFYQIDQVQKSLAQVDENNIGRPHSFTERYSKQVSQLKLPSFPTTTIGSYPQTKEIRKTRADFKGGRITKEEYDQFIKEKIEEVIRLQEEIGLDVLVHGEFERSDMVEFFGEKMDGFAFTKNGWVQSYGTRCVRPPIIYGDVYRPHPMTLNETIFAQSLTEKPVKGMLTGPVTILNWSFYRKDISKKEIAYQIALALKDEILDLERNNIKLIQIDEPAFREGLPLKKSKQKQYLDWAVKAFKLSHDTVKEETQIHTHMCYSEFNEIIDSIHAMDSDVISIEASRSKGEILLAFENFNYDHGIGLGVYDIHSPRVPSVEEMKQIVDRSCEVINPSLLWINPDCGLKTRDYEETRSALKNMVLAVQERK